VRVWPSSMARATRTSTTTMIDDLDPPVSVAFHNF
jgi:hypothetical protein